MPALSLDHWNVYCKDLKATVRFYERYVGLKDGDRPPFNFPGAWLYAGEKPILHLVSETGRKDHGSGAIDHVAINCENIRGTIDQLKKDKMPFEVRKVPARPLAAGLRARSRRRDDRAQFLARSRRAGDRKDGCPARSEGQEEVRPGEEAAGRRQVDLRWDARLEWPRPSKDPNRSSASRRAARSSRPAEDPGRPADGRDSRASAAGPRRPGAPRR